MARKLIAEIKLAPGQVGYYDELTNIHLTLTYPFGKVYYGMNTSNLQRSLKSKRLELLSGSLVPKPISTKTEEVKATYTVVKEEISPKYTVEAEAKEVKAEPVKVEPEVEAIEEVKVEEVQVETLAEIVEEAQAEDAEQAIVAEVKEEVKEKVKEKVKKTSKAKK